MEPSWEAKKRKFALFAQHTDEKKKIVSAVSQIANPHKKMSLLDIGAGTGEVSIPISSMVGRYLAIEKNPNTAWHLSNNGLDCMNVAWEDTSLKERFDVVLASHVLSFFKNKIRHEMISKMYNHVSPGGKLIIITDSGEGDFSELLTSFYPWVQNPPSVDYSIVEKDLERIGLKSSRSYDLCTRLLVPKVIFTGFFDFFLHAELDEYQALAPELARESQKYERMDGVLDLSVSSKIMIIEKQLPLISN